MTGMLSLCMMFLCVSVTNGAHTSDLTAENLRAMPQIKLHSDDIVNLLGGNRVGCWKLLDTTIPVNRRHLISEATEIQSSTDFDNSWLFYVTEKGDQKVFVLIKLINTQSGDDLLMISTPITPEFANNPWVAATMIRGALTNEDEDMLAKIFKPFLGEE